MIFLPGLAVIFAGLVGGNGDVDAQVKTVLQKLHVKAVGLPASKVQLLTHHGEATRALVRSLHVDGVIACEVVKGNSLRIVIYEGDGKLKTFSEVPLTGKKLGRDDLDVLRSNLADDVAAMRGNDEPEPEPEIVIDPLPKSAPQPKNVEPVAKKSVEPVPKAIVEPAPKKIETPTAKVEPSAKAGSDVAVDDETPAGMPATTVAAADDAVSADEIAALTSGTGESVSGPARSLHLGASAGIGIASRAFSPGPSTVLAYSSSPVPAIAVDAFVRPTSTIALAIGLERTLQLSTPMSDGTAAATTISRWEAAGTFALIQRPAFDIGLRAGFGRRSFTIASADTARSPDGDYNYVIAGVAATTHLGERIALRAAAAFEPVLFGTEPTEMAFGEASRWAVEVGLAVEARVTNHVFVRAAAQYQRFRWSWNMAGARGEGGAVDEYPSGALSLGADY